MATRRSFNRRPSAAPRRKRVWSREVNDVTIAAGGVGQLDLLADFATGYGANIVGATVGRVRMNLVWETTSTPNSRDALTFGVRVGGRQVDTIDQDPGDAIGRHLDWMYWRQFFPVGESSSAGVLGTAALEVDIKAQRRMEELGQTLWFVISGTTDASIAGTAGVAASTLLLLP